MFLASCRSRKICFSAPSRSNGVCAQSHLARARRSEAWKHRFRQQERHQTSLLYFSASANSRSPFIIDEREASIYLLSIPPGPNLAASLNLIQPLSATALFFIGVKTSFLLVWAWLSWSYFMPVASQINKKYNNAAFRWSLWQWQRDAWEALRDFPFIVICSIEAGHCDVLLWRQSLATIEPAMQSVITVSMTTFVSITLVWSFFWLTAALKWVVMGVLYLVTEVVLRIELLSAWTKFAYTSVTFHSVNRFIRSFGELYHRCGNQGPFTVYCLELCVL